MSKHWNPEDSIGRCTPAEGEDAPQKAVWPEGATAGLLLVAAGCAGLALLLYHLAGPRDVFAP